LNATESLLLALCALAAHPMLAREPAVERHARPLFVLVLAYAGLALPDIDHPLPLDHRSALTHSAAPLALAFWRAVPRAAIAGLAIGLGLHLADDVVTTDMVGLATVKVPFLGSLGAWSYPWLLGHAALCTWLGATLLRGVLPDPRLRAAVLGATAVMAVWYLLGREGNLAALLLYGLLGWLVFRRGA